MGRFIKNLVRQAGAIVKEGYRTKLKISYKSGPHDLVTNYDMAAEKYIIDRIRKKYPHHGILSEESGHIIKKKDFWIIDPIDGTTAFTRGLAQFSVCAAFVSNNVIEMSAIYDPIGDELFFAEKGKGAFRNGKKIFVSPKSDMDHAWIARHGRRYREAGGTWKAVNRLMEDRRFVLMRTGSSQLSGGYTACGRYDILLIQGLNPWDIAASALVLREAGARVTALDGSGYRWDMNNVLAANPKLHKSILGELS